MSIKNVEKVKQLLLKHKLAIEYSSQLITANELCNEDIVNKSFDLADRMVERVWAEAEAAQNELKTSDSFFKFMEEMLQDDHNQGNQVQ